MVESDLSIVIAAWPDTTGLAECLQALAPQREPDTEVVVVATQPAPAELAERFPWVRWLVAAPGRLIPHLWGLGIARSSGSVVAVTTAHFTQAPGWVGAIRHAHARLEAPAVGGPIDPPRGGRLVEWATFFLRYSPYLRYRTEEAVADLAGDNASYKRAALRTCLDLSGQGFWELDLHRRLRAAGQPLVFVPGIRVTQRLAFRFRHFLRQRFLHGRHFGSERFRGRGPWVRAVAVAASPLIPVVFLGKIVGRVAQSGRDFGPFLAALPVLACFLLAWSLGEASGYLLPARRAVEAPRCVAVNDIGPPAPREV